MKQQHPHRPREPQVNYRTATTGEDVTRENIIAMRRLEEAQLAQRTWADRVAAAIGQFCGSMTLVWVHVGIFGAYILFNTLPGFAHFDPYPFTFLTLMVSLEAIFLSTFILISQNYELRMTGRRNQLDLQINLLAEQENTKMLQMLQQIAKKVGAHVDDDPQIRALEEATRPDSLLRQIEEVYRDSGAVKAAPRLLDPE